MCETSTVAVQFLCANLPTMPYESGYRCTDEAHYTDLWCSCHVDTSLQEVAEVLSKLAGGSSQVLGGCSRRLDNLIGRLVQIGCHFIKLTLNVLETPSTGWELERRRATVRITLQNILYAFICLPRFMITRKTFFMKLSHALRHKMSYSSTSCFVRMCHIRNVVHSH